MEKNSSHRRNRLKQSYSGIYRELGAVIRNVIEDYKELPAVFYDILSGGKYSRQELKKQEDYFKSEFEKIYLRTKFGFAEKRSRKREETLEKTIDELKKQLENNEILFKNYDKTLQEKDFLISQIRASARTAICGALSDFAERQDQPVSVVDLRGRILGASHVFYKLTGCEEKSSVKEKISKEKGFLDLRHKQEKIRIKIEDSKRKIPAAVYPVYIPKSKPYESPVCSVIYLYPENWIKSILKRFSPEKTDEQKIKDVINGEEANLSFNQI